MAKIVLALFLGFTILLGDSSNSIYEKNCVACHSRLPVDIEKFFFRYLLKYSSEREVKKNIVSYLKKPAKDKSVMGESFLKRFGIKEPLKIGQKELKEAVDIYWEKYKVFGRIK